jgi:hypothetical protein
VELPGRLGQVEMTTRWTGAARLVLLENRPLVVEVYLMPSYGVKPGAEARSSHHHLSPAQFCLSAGNLLTLKFFPALTKVYQEMAAVEEWTSLPDLP